MIINNNFVFLYIYEYCLPLQLHHNYEAMNINNLLSTFEQGLRLQRYSDAYTQLQECSEFSALSCLAERGAFFLP